MSRIALCHQTALLATFYCNFFTKKKLKGNCLQKLVDEMAIIPRKKI